MLRNDMTDGLLVWQFPSNDRLLVLDALRDSVGDMVRPVTWSISREPPQGQCQEISRPLDFAEALHAYADLVQGIPFRVVHVSDKIRQWDLTAAARLGRGRGVPGGPARVCRIGTEDDLPYDHIAVGAACDTLVVETTRGFWAGPGDTRIELGVFAKGGALHADLDEAVQAALTLEVQAEQGVVAANDDRGDR